MAIHSTSSLNYHLTSSDSDKPYIALIHGLFGDLNNLAMIRRELESDFNVLSIDLPDHGQSQYSQIFSFAGYAQVIIELLDYLKIEKCHMLGHSLGGKVAMTIALEFPQKVDKLLLADIAPVAYSPRHQNVFNGLQNVNLANTRDRKHAENQLADHIIEPGVRQFLLKSLFRHEEQWQWRFNLSLLIRDYPLLSAAVESNNQFDGDVLFIKGSESDYLLASHKEAIAKLFPNSQAKIIQGTGHWLHAEKPSIFNRIVKAFLHQ